MIRGDDLLLDHLRCLDRDALAVYTVISKYADHRGQTRVSLSLLGFWSGCSGSRVQQALAELETHPLIEVARRPGHGNVYSLLYYASQPAPRMPELGPEMDGPYLVH